MAAKFAWLKRVVSWIVPIAILLGGILAMSAVRNLKTPPASAAEEDATPEVRVVQVARHESGFSIEIDGRVVPYRVVEIAAEVGGRVVTKEDRVEAGYFVQQGDPLVTLEQRDYELSVSRFENEVAQARLALEEAKSDLMGTEDQLEVAREELALRVRELNRQRELGPVVGAGTLERAEANELAARNNKISLENRLRLLGLSTQRLEQAQLLSELRLEQAELDLSRTQITAPVDGVIVSEYVEENAYVQPGTVVVALEDTSRAEVACKLEMSDLFWLWDQADPDAPRSPFELPQVGRVEVVYRQPEREAREYVWYGTLERFDGLGLDERTRTVPCRVVVDDPVREGSSGPPALVRGMYVTVRIHVQPRTELLRIPESSLQPGNVVWRVRDGELRILTVHYVRHVSNEGSSWEDRSNQDVLVYVDEAESLTPADVVVTSPLSFVRSGMPVRVVQPEE